MNEKLELLYQSERFVDFLKAWIEHQKSIHTNYSLGQLARNLSLSSTGELSNILKGRRPISHSILDRFKAYINFPEENLFYLDLLAERDRNLYNPIISRLIKEKIETLRRERSEKNHMELAEESR